MLVRSRGRGPIIESEPNSAPGSQHTVHLAKRALLVFRGKVLKDRAAYYPIEARVRERRKIPHVSYSRLHHRQVQNTCTLAAGIHDHRIDIDAGHAISGGASQNHHVGGGPAKVQHVKVALEQPQPFI